MYPKTYLDSFRDFDRTDEVFVAMPFAEEFEKRWKKIFCPAIANQGLKPYRVDIRVVSDSILTDILAGIGRARLVLADTSFQLENDRPAGPNVNVMYELGVAHAMRLPEEVIVVRDSTSTDAPPFDVTHIRYHRYDPEDADTARSIIEELISTALKAIDITRDLIVDKTLRSLDPDEIRFLGTIGTMDWFDLYPFDTDRKGIYILGDRDSSEGELKSIARRLTVLGVLRSGDPGPPEKRVYGAVCEYLVTALGKAVWERLPMWCKSSV
jgi:hypothetical protein